MAFVFDGDLRASITAVLRNARLCAAAHVIMLLLGPATTYYCTMANNIIDHLLQYELLPLTPKPLKSFSQSAHEHGRQSLSNFEMLQILT